MSGTHTRLSGIGICLSEYVTNFPQIKHSHLVRLGLDLSGSLLNCVGTQS